MAGNLCVCDDTIDELIGIKIFHAVASATRWSTLQHERFVEFFYFLVCPVVHAVQRGRVR